MGFLLYCSCLDVVLTGIQPTLSSEPLPASSCPPSLFPSLSSSILHTAAPFSFLSGLSVHTGVHTCRCPVYICSCFVRAHLHACWLVCRHARCLCVQMCVLCLHRWASVRACVHACMHGALRAHVHAFSVHTSLVAICLCASMQACACMRPCE